MDIKQRYIQIAAQLGDLEYRMQRIADKRGELLREMTKLDELAGMELEAQKKSGSNGQKNEAQDLATKGNSAGSNSPA